MTLSYNISRNIISFGNNIDLKIEHKIFQKININKFEFINPKLKNLRLVSKFVNDHNYMAYIE